MFMSVIIAKVKTLLQKKNYNPINDPNDDNILILPGLSGKNGKFTLDLIGKDVSTKNDAILLSQTEFPIKVPSNKREKILSFLNEINKDTSYSWLSLNMENGGIICRSCNRSKSDDSMNDDILEPVLFSSLVILDELQPFILDLIYSEKTVDMILKEINQSTN